MGGGESKPRITGPMLLIDEQWRIFGNYQNGNYRYTSPYVYVGGQSDGRYVVKGGYTWNTQRILEWSFNSIINKIPEHGDEATKINYWKGLLVAYLPGLLPNVQPNEIIKNLVDQIVELKLILAAKKENLDSDPNTQARTIDYYHKTKLLFSPIDNKYLAIVGTVSKNIEKSDYLSNIIRNFLEGKIRQQFARDSLLRGNENDEKFFFSMCVKVIEDKPLNMYGDNETPITTVQKEAYDDNELKYAGIFKDVESLKGACKFFLFIVRKKKCSKYIMQNTREAPNEDEYRTCRIVGVEAINKPQSVLDAEKEAKEGFENFDGNRSASESTNQSESNLPKVEKFQENNIFKKIETNLKLVLGYALILAVIGILLYISPAVFNSLYNVSANYIIPAIIAIFGVLGETILVMTKLVSASMEALFALIGTISEGTFNILSSIFSVISDLFMVFIKFGADGASGVTNYVIDQLSTVFKIITEGGQSILELIYNLFSSLAEKIFNYMKKYYMTINNIEAE